jgi:hypothetical protein
MMQHQVELVDRMESQSRNGSLNFGISISITGQLNFILHLQMANISASRGKLYYYKSKWTRYGFRSARAQCVSPHEQYEKLGGDLFFY